MSFVTPENQENKNLSGGATSIYSKLVSFSSQSSEEMKVWDLCVELACLNPS